MPSYRIVGKRVPSDDPPPTDDPPQAPAPQGSVIYALDNGNRLLVFGTESGSTISRMVNISGMPILKRMIGIDFRPSNRKLYGVGNDSRVYVIDTLSGAATPVGSGPFSPSIISSFDIHFGMDFDPATDRIRLISNELGGNWSIDPDDGTAIAGKSPRYAAGDPNEGETPHIGGLTYVPASAIPASGAVHLKVAELAAASGPCEDLLWAMDTKLSNMITSCDPDNNDWSTLGPIEGITALACVELDYSGPGGGIWAAGQGINDAFNSIETVDPESGKIDWKVNVPDNWLIQSITFEPTVEGVEVRRRRPRSVSRSRARQGRAPASPKVIRWPCVAARGRTDRDSRSSHRGSPATIESLPGFVAPWPSASEHRRFRRLRRPQRPASSTVPAESRETRTLALALARIS
jgi:hypothetical protein